ncbi:hypothetical protein AB3N59_06585 [Leptospira sp. WS92.C1]
MCFELVIQSQNQNGAQSLSNHFDFTQNSRSFANTKVVAIFVNYRTGKLILNKKIKSMILNAES